MSRYDELEEERALEAWRAEQQLLGDLCAYVLRRAARCHHCRAFAMWCKSSRPRSGFPSDDFECDTHRRDGAVELRGADVLRRVLTRMKNATR
jgi:hypothetical protein